MKSSTRLEQAVFQLTPTRTRCDLIIIANDRKEKIASGLLKPFLMHLKTAEDQIAKGGYSILLMPEPGNDATWFTKGTMERFVRFVSTPEVLERVHTIESEILQIEEAISFQKNNDGGRNTIEDHHSKPIASNEGNKPLVNANGGNAIVLYKPDSQLPETSDSVAEEANSKVQLLKILETRKSVLQKEQGMVFARAVAAGFDLDNMTLLKSFAESFGASRLTNACTRFMDLWKKKNETGQWIEYDAAEAMSCKLDLSAMPESGVVLSSVANKQNGSHSEVISESNGKSCVETTTDDRPPTGHQVPGGPPEYFQFPQTMFPGWPMHASPGTLPIFQAYPMQGMSFYPNYPINGPYYQPPYPSTEESLSGIGHGTGEKRQFMVSRDHYNESELSKDDPKTISHDTSELVMKASCGRESQKKAGRLGKKQSGMVVIRNINYIASKRQSSSGSELDSDSNLEMDNEAGELQTDSPDMMHKNHLRSSSNKGRWLTSMDELNLHDTEDTNEADGAHWEAFQNCLLKGANEDGHCDSDKMFGKEKNILIKRQENSLGDNSLAISGRYPVAIQDKQKPEFLRIGETSRKPRMSSDEVSISRRVAHYGNGGMLSDDQMDMHFMEINGRNAMYRTRNDGFMVNGQENQSHLGNSSNPLAVDGFECVTNNLDGKSSHNMVADESFIIPFRSMSLGPVEMDDRIAIDMNAELPATKQKSENACCRVGSRSHYEPNDLTLMPERGTDKSSMGYDPALDYEMQVCAEGAASQDKRNKQVLSDAKQISKRSDKDGKAKTTPDSLDKKKTGGPIRKAKPSKPSPMDNARARAERMRTYKADLQKMKKEQEDAELKRLEALKMERQKRIAARASSASAQTHLPSLQIRSQLPTKLSPISCGGSKFIDAEPGSSSPLQRSKIRPASLGSCDTQKTLKVSKSGDSSQSAGNRLSRSVSSLSQPKGERNDTTPDSTASMARIRRLSEPKSINCHVTSSVKTQSAEPAKQKVIKGLQSKNISATVNHDRSKTATLPEQKTRTSKGTLNAGHQNKPAGREMTLKKNGSKLSAVSKSAELSMNDDKLSHQSDVDDNLVIEKTVVMLECLKTSNPVHELKEKMGVVEGNCNNHDVGGKMEVVSDYSAIRAPPTPVDGVDMETISIRLQEQPVPYAVSTNFSEREVPSVSCNTATEKTCEAPLARVSSLEDPCTRNTDYGKTSAISLEVLSTSWGTAGAHVSDLKNIKLEKIPENLEKPQVKDSSKGFRRLLKFTRKNHSSYGGEQGLESDSGSKIDSEPQCNKCPFW